LLENDEREDDGNDEAALGAAFCVSDDEDSSSSCFPALRYCCDPLDEEVDNPENADLLFLIDIGIFFNAVVRCSSE
jgi:hypothetical protein